MQKPVVVFTMRINRGFHPLIPFIGIKPRLSTLTMFSFAHAEKSFLSGYYVPYSVVTFNIATVYPKNSIGC
jgi:hypothetical protein